MTTSLTKISEVERQKLLDGMHPITAQLATDGAEKLTRFRNAGVLLMMELGCQIDSITNNESIEDNEGEVTKLAAFWGQDNTNRLYEWRNTAAAFCKTVDDDGEVIYDKSGILEMLKQPLKNGSQLEFEHFKHLGRIANAKTRKALLTQVRKNSWSANALAQEIKGNSTDTKNKRSGGRKPQVPGSVFQLVQKTQSQSQQLNNYLYECTDAASELFTEIPTDKADEGFVEKLDDVIELMNNLVNTINKHVDLLIDGRDHVEKVISNTQREVNKDTGAPVTIASDMDAEEEYITGTAIAAKIRNQADGKKKRGRPRKTKK